MKKRILSVLLSLVMVVGLLPTAALAAAPTGATEGAIEEKTVTVIKELNFLAEPQYIKLTHGQTAGEWLANLKARGNLHAAEGNGWKVVDVMRVRRASGNSVLKDTDTFDKSTGYCVEVKIALTDSTQYDWQSTGMKYAITVNGDIRTSVPLNVNYTSVLLYLRFDYVIDEVKLNVTAPVAGRTPSTTATPSGEGYTVSSVSWYEKSSYDANGRTEVTAFENNKSYVAGITVAPKTGYLFIANSNSPLTARVNSAYTAADTMLSQHSAYFVVVFPASGSGNVTFHPNGGSGTMNDVQTLTSLPTCTFTAPTGKTFDGWSLKPNGDKLTSAPSISGKSITLFARWKDTAETTTVNTVKNFYFAAEPSKIKITNGKDIDEWLAELKSSGNFRAANSVDGWEVEEIQSVNDGTEKHKTNPGDKFDTSHTYYMTVQLRATGSNVLLPMNGTKIGLYVNGDKRYNGPMGVKSLVQVYLRTEETISNASVTVPAPSVSATPDSIEPTVPTGAGYTATILAWYEKTSYDAGGRNQVTAFEGGKSYVPFIQLTAKEGYYFPVWATMTVNGNAPKKISGSTDKVSDFGPAILCPTQDLSGTVTYTGAARYGATLTANVTGAPSTAALSYQWQYKNGSTWTDIPDATQKTYGPTDATGDMVNKDIRVKVSAEGYLGSIYGAAKTVTKDVCYAIPVAPVLSYDSGTICVTNPQNNQEYYWTTDDPGSGTKTWPKDGGVDVTTNLTDNSFTGNTGTTYYVYTRVKETNAKRAGEIVRTGSISIPYASSDIYTPATGLIYPDYPTTPRTIYVPINGTATVNYQITPTGANNDLPQWAESTVDGTPRLSNVSAENGVLTITAGSTAGDTKVVTKKTDGNLFGQGAEAGYEIRVTVYDPANLASTITSYTSTNLDTVELYKGDTHTLDLDDLKDTLNFLPAGISRNGYTLKAYILKTGSGYGAGPTFETIGDYISIEPDTGKITATNYAEGNETKVYLAVLAPGETTANPSKYAATLTVKVKQNNIPLESITVNPTKLTLHKNDTFTLSAIKTPVNAAGDITWESNATGVATVDSDGKVTAVAESGTATITAKNSDGSITATCTVTVKPAACTTHTSLTYADFGTQHQWTCGTCGVTGLEDHDYGAWAAVTDTDTHKRTCTNCNHEETANHSWVVDSTGSTTAGSVAYKCDTTGCTATKTVTLTAITNAPLTVTAPVRDAAPADAATTESTFYVAYTTWYPDVSGTFAAGTVYSVQIDLEAFSGNYFTETTNFTINGNAPTSTYIDPAGEMASLTYTFPATAGGSSGSSGGGGGSYTPSYAITVEDAKNGDVTVSPKSASKGATVTVTVAPDKGYDLETLTVLDKDGKEIKLTDKGNGKYTFTMPASKVTVKGTFMEDNTMLNFFVDVPADAYYYDAVLWAAENGITGGVDAVHFAPNAACTRAQIVTFLYRAAGSPEPKTASSFSDVPADAYYTKAVAWAVENGITGGIGGNKFAPGVTCTRAQAVTFLYRAAGSPAVSGGATFSDVSAEAYYANAVAWAAANGITGGIGGGLFGSNNDCTRAQIVTFLYRSVK